MYVTAAAIKLLRERKGLTQAELADRIGVTDKAVSKWETAKGFPDISLIEPLSEALGVSVAELMNGEQIINKNKSSNMLHAKFYVCPICGNIITCTGETVISCCGIILPALEAEEADNEHNISVEIVENERFVTVHHDMTKTHHISFMALTQCDRINMVKLYPEGNAQTRFPCNGRGTLYIYCNKHGFMKQKI